MVKPRNVGLILGVSILAVCAALTFWGLSGPGDPIALLASKNPDQRQKGLAALSADNDSAEGIERIAEAVRHADPAVACRGLQALAAGHGEARPLPPEAIQVLQQAAVDPRPAVKTTAIHVLEAATPPAPEDPTVPKFLLKVFVAEPLPETRAAAANALGKLQYWDAVEPMLDALEDNSVEVRSAAGAAVRKILGLDFGYRATDPPIKRSAAVARIRQQWKGQRLFHEHYVNRLRQQRKASP